MRVGVLGPVELADAEGGPRSIGSANQRTVLAVLLAARGEVVSVDALVDAVWGDRPPASAVPTLRTYVSRLRHSLGPALAGQAGGYVLAVPTGELDADRFDALVEAAAAAAEPSDAAELLAAALGLWRGPAFGDRADIERVRAEARRLDERRAAAREAHAAALLAAGRAAEAVAAAEALVAAEPLREGGWAVLIEALTASHRPAEALRAFRRAASALAEAGLEPSRRLRSAERTALAAGDGTADAPAAAPHRFRPPAPASSLVGRDHDVGLVAELLEHTRLVTLTGPGGVGKTRLALEVARRVAERRQLGACVVELAPVEDPAAVADVVIASLGLGADGPTADVLPRVGELDALVVLDNAEHVVDEAAAVAERILAGGGRARLLVTSRERLAIDGEHVWSVAPLPTAGAEPPAVRLLRERAAAVGADPGDDVAARIVQRLDGLPLAIEMAAAELDTTTPDELAAALDERLDDLRSARREGPARHRSLADVLAWSEARLDDRAARTLAELSVFAGPVAATDLEGVLGDGVVDVARGLARRSLVVVERDRAPARFRLLQTIRSFARQRLADAGQVDALARRHAEWFTGVVRRAGAGLRTTDEAIAAARIDAVFAEVRAAYAWAAGHDVDLAADLVAHLHTYAHSQFVDEPLLWAEQLLGELAAEDPRRPLLMASAATRAIRRGDIDAARRLAASARELAGDSAAALPALDALTDAGLFDGRTDESAASARAMLDLARRHGDALYQALGLSGAALAACYGGARDRDAEAAVAAVDEAPLPPSGRGWLAYTRGELAQDDDADVALAHYATALAHARAVGNRYIEGAAIASSCALRARRGDPGEALAAFAEGVRHWIRLANTAGQLTTLRNLAVLFQRLDAPDAAAELLASVDRGDVPTYGEEAVRLAQARAWAAERLGAERFAARTALGAGHDLTAAAHAALEAIEVVSRRLANA